VESAATVADDARSLKTTLTDGPDRRPPREEQQKDASPFWPLMAMENAPLGLTCARDSQVSRVA